MFPNTLLNHIRCPEEQESGSCSTMNCAYLHRNKMAQNLNFSNIQNTLNLQSNEQEEYDPHFPSGTSDISNICEYNNINYTPSSAPSIPDYGNCNTTENTSNLSTQLSSMEYLKNILSLKPNSNLTTIPRDKKPEYLIPNDLKPTKTITKNTPTNIIKKKTVDRSKLLSQTINISSINKRKEKPIIQKKTKNIKEKETKKKDILDMIPKSEYPVIEWNPKAHITVAQRRPKLDHFLRLFLNHLKPNETYKDAIKKAVDVENEIYLSCGSFNSYRVELGFKFVKIRKELQEEK